MAGNVVVAIPGTTQNVVVVQAVPGPAGGVANIVGTSPMTTSSAGGIVTIGLGTVGVANGGTGLTSVGASGFVLTSTGTATVWAASPVTGITQLTGDVTAGAGTGSQAATVLRVNGATVPAAGALTTGNSLYVSGTATLSYSALNLAGGSGWVTGNLPVTNVAPSATNGQILTTVGGVSTWAAAPTSGITSFTGDVSAAISGGVAATTVTEAQNGAVVFGSNAGTGYCYIQGYTAGTFGAIYLGLLSGITPNSGNYTLLGGPTAQLNGSAGCEMQAGGNNVLTASSSAITASVGTFQFVSSATPSLTQTAPTVDTAIANLTIQAQSAYSSATTHYQGGSINLTAGAGATAVSGQSGSVNVNLFAPIGAGVEPYFNVTRSGTTIASIGGVPTAASTRTGLWLSTPSITATSATIEEDTSGDVQINSPSSLVLNSGGGVTINSGSTAVTLSSGSGTVTLSTNWGLNLGSGSSRAGGGGGTICLGECASNPTTNITGNSVIYTDASTGNLSFYPQGVTVPTVAIGTVNSGAGVVFLQNAVTQPSGAVSNGVVLASNGGSLVLLDGAGITNTIALGGMQSNTSMSFSPTAVTSGSAYTMTIRAGQSTGVTSALGSTLLLAGGNATGTTTTGGTSELRTGTGTTINGTLTLNSGTSTVYGTFGSYSSGNHPGSWTWNGPACTTTQLVTTGKTTLSASGCYFFLPITLNGVTAQIVCTS